MIIGIRKVIIIRVAFCSCLTLIFSIGFPEPVSGQIYFNLTEESIQTKALKAGYDFTRKSGAEPDSAYLEFKKREEDTYLVCYLNSFGVCYQFAYRFPDKVNQTVITNLNKNFTRRKNGWWENKEKTFLVGLLEEKNSVTVIYIPYSAPE